MISKMKKLLLGGKASEKEKVLEVLREAGVVHVDAAVPEKVSVPASINEELHKCNRAIIELSQIECLSDEDKIETPGKAKRLIEETLEHVTALSKLKDKLIALKKEYEETEVWGPLGLKDLYFLKNSGLNIVFSKGSKEHKDEIKSEFVDTVYCKDGICVFIAASRNEIEIPKQLTVIEAPRRESAQIADEIKATENTICDHKHALQCLKLRFSDIQAHYTKLLNQKRFAEVESGVMTDEEVFVLTGWCPEKKVSTLSEALETAQLRVATHFDDAAEDENPPTYLDNPVYSSSINPLYDFMGLTPSYNEPDASFLFLSTLIIFSGFLVADAGYGAIIALPLLFGYKKLKERGVDEKFLRLAIFLFGGATVYGGITNSWFGASLFNTGFNPESPDGSFLLQALCFLMGVIHLTIAHIIKLKRKKINLSVVGEIGWIIFLWAMYGMICKLVAGRDFILPGTQEFTILGSTSSLTVWLFKISLTMILFFTAPSFNVFKMVGAGVGSILTNASAAFSDILSYIRLWAVGLAGSKVAVAFNDIGAMLPIYAQIPVLIAGHGLNIILCVIAILAHGVRLNLLEFSNHLELDWAGREYDPFKKIN
ncbi:MAG: V-type ATPase 116kDa subunit family protein [Candidatus Riflebacteria bacterium]|nr:V-type ATPase 116kDa subunit family protein [Candidatus Riflebacteria bacterium]